MSRKFSGKILVRTDPRVHQALFEQAHKQGLSLNSLSERIFRQGISGGNSAEEKTSPLWKKPLLTLLEQEIGKQLLGLILFGSQARGEAGATSDIDLLVVVDKSFPIDRDLYRRMDRQLRAQGLPRISLHFVPFPIARSEAGSLWYEVALEGIVLFLCNDQLPVFLSALRNDIAEHRLRRQWSHGHPYWRRIL